MAAAFTTGASKTWLINQQVTWKTLYDHFHGHYDYYMSELEAGDKAGPGALAMSPQMKIPDYTRHEIHIQPGGYVADPDTIRRLEGENQVVFRYLDDNPNGSLNDIAGVTNARGNVVGLMPHPEHNMEELTSPSVDGRRFFSSLQRYLGALVG